MTGDKDINIKFIDGKDQRYPTCGDYWETETSYEFRITKQTHTDKNILIVLHEMIEFFVCGYRDIAEQEITNFDLMWEQGPKLEDEPGNCKELNGIINPYYREHRFSENIERQVALEIDIDWQEYSDNLIL